MFLVCSGLTLKCSLLSWDLACFVGRGRRKHQACDLVILGTCSECCAHDPSGFTHKFFLASLCVHLSYKINVCSIYHTIDKK